METFTGKLCDLHIFLLELPFPLSLIYLTDVHTFEKGMPTSRSPSKLLILRKFSY